MNKNVSVSKVFEVFYVILLSSLYGMIACGAVLGVSGFFRKPYSIIFALFVTATLVIYLFSRKDLFHPFTRWDRIEPRDDFLDGIVYFLSIALIGLLILLPVIRWPLSIAADWFPWDAGLYHFPKAVEMVQAGTANDLSIAYGEYPFGYETLLAYGLSLTGNTSLFGWLHGLVDLFFILSLWLLARRMTGIRSSLLLFSVVVMIFSGLIFRFLNIWQVFLPEVYTVGKNDLLLAAGIIGMLAFFPIKDHRFNLEENWLAFGLTAMLALSVKPNAALVLAPLWLAGAVNVKIALKNKKPDNKPRPVIIKEFLFSTLAILPGALWLARNFFIQGEAFSETVLAASDWSIVANINNPFFNQFIPKNMIAILLFTAGLGLLSLYKKPRYRWAIFILLVLEIAFAFTPVTAFFKNTDVPAKINWRFGEAMLAYLFVLLLSLAGDWADRIFQRGLRMIARYVTLAASLILTVFFFASQWHALQIKPENAFVLRDQFPQPVGVEGYHSAYDYIQRNVRSSVVWVENGLPFYVYDAGFTNSVTRRKNPDYIVVMKQDWFGEGGGMDTPPYFSDNWPDIYQVVYEDPQGVIFTPRD